MTRSFPAGLRHLNSVANVSLVIDPRDPDKVDIYYGKNRIGYIEVGGYLGYVVDAQDHLVIHGSHIKNTAYATKVVASMCQTASRRNNSR